jgi:hypothetical protein
MERRVKDVKPDSPATVLDVTEHERTVEEIELLSDVRTAVEQIEAGQGISDGEAKAQLRRRFRR